MSPHELAMAGIKLVLVVFWSLVLGVPIGTWLGKKLRRRDR